MNPLANHLIACGFDLGHLSGAGFADAVAIAVERFDMTEAQAISVVNGLEFLAEDRESRAA